MAGEDELRELSALLGAILPALMRAMERRIDREFPHPKPPDTQLSLMRLVRERDGITVREAAEALLMKPNNVSSLVSLLVKEGLLTRVQDPDDKRIAHLHVTDLALDRLTAVDDLITAYALESLRRLTDDQITALDRAVPGLNALAAHIREAAV
ncbi:MarR family winged helix-turn-helix transcriptional regulator [Actinocorallia aurantiaca]|uniref:MarR family winged helix-turn-helix transcriptional regulator n=1 Tax=Actinocorallia aurantiaca TaxID=46204 RepID=A0ABN3TU26_9ACTN